MFHHITTLSTPILLLIFLSPLTTSLHHHNDAAVAGDTPLARFQTYLRFNTAHPNPNYTGPISFLTAQARSIGLQACTLEFTPTKPVLLLTWPGTRPDLPSILLNSHLDSVPAEPHKWLHPPFAAAATADGKIYARGAQDDKCISIQYLEAIRNLRERNFAPIRTVHVSYVPEEEVGGMEGAAKFVASEEFEKLNVGFAIDEGQASITDEFRVFYADRSPWHVTITAVGPPGHGSRMYDDSAMENLMKSVEMMSKFRESQFDLVKRGWRLISEVVSVNPVFLNAGIRTGDGYAMNMQPSEAQAGFDIRIPPTVDSELIRKRIVEEWAPASRNMTYEIVEKGPSRDNWGRPLMTATDDANPWWSVFRKAIEAAGGKLAKPEILTSTTDARFVRQRGIPALGFSPMSNTPILLHDHNEYLQDTVFLKGIEVYESLISSLSSYEEVHSA
ncbi:hypothetical protein RND81_01G218200 [Saponaria officinalis]|uniref:Peptidase M20 dimerisation domain-containing protein n=1 Tax=Saponaria officinalis TaxID=3572 RepID=A0AAW1NHK7_SAPOF